ncbi:Uncharacterised protein [Actinobacillus equuli]|nr:Uncharacterised protein [Actinobacillus equuli]
MSKLKLYYQFFNTELKTFTLLKEEKNYYFNNNIFFRISSYHLADIYYIDDLGRSIVGSRGWDNFSRFSSNFLSSILNMSVRLTDISPLTQIISIIILSISSLILVVIFSKKSSYFTLLGSTFLGLSPFYLENMSYKFDSPYMTLAILASLLPFLFIRNSIIFIIVGICSLLLMYTTYQAANAIF